MKYFKTAQLSVRTVVFNKKPFFFCKNMSLKNKVAIVTGASSGIGAAIANKFTEEGANVAIVGRNETKLKSVLESCQAIGAETIVIAADVTNNEDAKRIIKETLEKYGKIDILINNAGIGNPGSILDDTAMDNYNRVMSINLHAAVHLTHLAAKHLTETKGNIVNVSSVAGKMVMMNKSFAYCVSKAALDHFTRCIALELAPKGVRVNAVNPGPVRTDILENMGVDKEHLEQVWDGVKSNTALNRVSDAEEVADIVAYLVSDKGRSITGETLVIDAGVRLLGLVRGKSQQ